MHMTLPEPAACSNHLTPEERVLYVEDRDRWSAECDRMRLPRLIFVATADPVCWSWPAPGEDRLRKMTNDDRVAAMYTWQDERCAICGDDAQVTDHDHETAMVRGRLCQNCNINEGCSDIRGGIRGIWQKYRERNPASIWDVREVYFNSFTGRYAEPLPPYDPWKNNPMRGIGL